MPGYQQSEFSAIFVLTAMVGADFNKVAFAELLRVKQLTRARLAEGGTKWRILTRLLSKGERNDWRGINWRRVYRADS